MKKLNKEEQVRELSVRVNELVEQYNDPANVERGDIISNQIKELEDEIRGLKSIQVNKDAQANSKFEQSFLNNLVKLQNGEFGEIDLYDTICDELDIMDDSHDEEFEALLEQHIDLPSRAKAAGVNVPFDVKRYDSEVEAISLFSDQYVSIFGEHKMLLEDGRVVEQFIYSIEGKNPEVTYISLKANLLILKN